MRLFLALIFAAFGALPASAGEITSTYSELDLAKCETLLQSDDEGGSYEGKCPGYGGNFVMVWEGDLRQYLAYGPKARSQCTSAQTFGHFNHVLGSRLEWRLDGGKPFATILRWHTDTGEEGAKQSWLVVTKLAENDACHVAYVDGRLPDANLIARQRADGMARSFDCAKDMPEVVSRLEIAVTELAIGVPCPGGPYREE
jgi:hypothetical protein